MTDFFRVKIVAKRQVTLPQLMLLKLGLKEGDELEFTVADGAIRGVRAFRSMPLDYFPPETLEMIDRRTKELDSGVDGGYIQLPDPAAGQPEPVAMTVTVGAVPEDEEVELPGGHKAHLRYATPAGGSLKSRRTKANEQTTVNS
jgi:bifunctional DNA-binding transcriptional regulator/antitoxin component of YhaV-PrlF toxin-antitoxin module